MGRIEIEEELKKRLKEKAAIEKALTPFRKEKRKLAIYRCGTVDKWYVLADGERTYLPKSQREEAESLAKATWLRARLVEAEAGICACQKYLKSFHGEDRRLAKLLEQGEFCSLIGHPEYNDALWQKAEHRKNDKHPESLQIKQGEGNAVRSKSEALIAMTLDKYGISFRYESPLDTQKGRFFPDFTIRHPKNHKTYIWEHFGFMDDQEYAAQVSEKLQIYMDCGYVPGENFLMTFESGGHPLTPHTIEEVIARNFLQK